VRSLKHSKHVHLRGRGTDGNRSSRFVWTDADEDGQVDAGETSDITEYAWDARDRLVTAGSEGVCQGQTGTFYFRG